MWRHISISLPLRKQRQEGYPWLCSHRQITWILRSCPSKIQKQKTKPRTSVMAWWEGGQRPDILCLIPRVHNERKELTPKSCHLHSTLVLCWYSSMSCVHTIIMKLLKLLFRDFYLGTLFWGFLSISLCQPTLLGLLYSEESRLSLQAALFFAKLCISMWEFLPGIYWKTCF